MSRARGDSDRIINTLKADGTRFVILFFCDLSGVPRGLTIPVESIEKVLETGAWIDGSSIKGGTRRWESDMWLWPDTYAVYPAAWTQEPLRTAVLMCDLYTADEKEYDGDPRTMLKAFQDKVKKDHGLELMAGAEPEFYIIDPDDLSPQDHGDYFSLDHEQTDSIRREIMREMIEMGIEPEGAHHEVGSGQSEIDPRHTNAVIASDRIVLFKHLVKNVVSRFGMEASFMPKPFDEMPGNGMHCHLSLADEPGKNVFDPGAGKEFLSETAFKFMAGILHHGAALTAVLCPTVNSYKRHDTRYEAPTSIGWARQHRGAFIRVPECLEEERSKASRFELRVPDPSANPYLAMLAILACGIDGLKNDMDAPPAQEEVPSEPSGMSESDVKRVPTSLIEAIEHLRESKVIRDAFGERLFGNFLVALEAQWYEYEREHLSRVSYWEIEKYLRG